MERYWAVGPATHGPGLATRILQSDLERPAGCIRQEPRCFTLGAAIALVSNRTRPASNGGPGKSIKGHPRASRGAALTDRWRPVSLVPVWGSCGLTTRRARQHRLRHPPNRALGNSGPGLAGNVQARSSV